MNINTFNQIVMVLITLTIGIAVAHNIPAPLTLANKVPGWLFWGIGFVIQLKHIAFMGIPDPRKTNEIDFFELYIGMSEDDFR